MTGLDLLDAGLPARTPGWFTSRAGGVSRAPWDTLNLASHVGDEPSAVLANGDRLAASLGVSGVCVPQQVHGASVLVVDQAPHGLVVDARGGGADALVTAAPGITIGVLVADCMPVLLADPVAGVVAAAHAGRRGLVAGVLQAALNAMVGLGAAQQRIVAVIGPAICGRCYEVPAEMRAEVDTEIPGTGCVTARGTAGLDLPAGALAVLQGCGVSATAVGVCTAEDDRFYSYRRDGRTGRLAGVVMLAPDV